MMSKDMSDIKEFVGQPWSSWKKLVGNPFPDLVQKTNTTTKKSSYDDSSSCMKLQREDMAIFGFCPTTELFQLVVCNLCGNKFKLPALAEHIKIRHSNDNTSPVSVKCDKTEKHPQTKGKLKKTKERPKAKDKNEALGNALVNIESKVDFMEIVSDRQSLPLESENVPKFKQINVKINKKNQKSVENDSCKEDSNLLDKGNTCFNKKECVTEISCKTSAEPVWPKAHVKLGNSAIAQDGEVINMQPIVQLSPLSATTTSTPFIPSTPNILKTADNNKRSVLEYQSSNNVTAERTYNPDIHCGVVDKENTKPCIQLLNCSSHSLALKKTVQGRSKPVDVLLNDKKHDSVNSVVTEPCSSVNLDKVNSPVATKCVMAKSQTSSSNSYIEKTDTVDDNETKNKITKRLTSDRPRLSLPVSIKNPTILCQLQNKVMKSKFSLPVEATRNESIQDVIKGNFSQKQIRNPRACRASKENSRAQLQRKESNGNCESADNSKTSDVKMDVYDQWHPGYRRVGGLLYASHNIPCVNRTSVTSATSFAGEERCSSVIDASFNILSAKTEIIDLCSPSVNKLDLKKVQFELDCGVKKSVSSLPIKQKGHVLISTNSSKSQSHKQKLIVGQPVSNNNNNNKTVICKRTNNNINGAVPAKIKKQEGIVNIVRPVFGKNDHTLPVMHLEVANNVFEKQILTPTQHIPSPNSLGASVQTGVNVIRGSSIRIGPPRIHYITASGPLPVSIQQVASVQQLQLKQMRFQHKYQLLSPQVNITPTSGVFYIQKTPTSSPSVNGVEER